MKKKIIGLFVCMLLATTILSITAMAGDENNHEIVDEENDCSGPLVTHPIRLKVFQIFGILPIDSFDCFDIVSAWFYEDSAEPEYLYAALKLKDLTVVDQDALYSVSWSYMGKDYVVGSYLWQNGEETYCIVGISRWLSIGYKTAEATYDFEKNIVTFKFSKEYIGNPSPGDVITHTFAGSGLRLNFEPLTLLFGSGELVRDRAPNTKTYGKDYIIQY